MSCLYVNLRKVIDANYDLPYIEAKADLAKRRTRNIKMEIPVCISNKYQIEHRLDEVCKEIEKLEMKISKLYEVTNGCMEQYYYAELKNSINAQMFN